MNDNFENNKNGYDGYSSDNNTADNNYQDIHSSSDSQSASTAENTESSYEWNTNSTSSVNSGEYRHSYINGNKMIFEQQSVIEFVTNSILNVRL